MPAEKSRPWQRHVGGSPLGRSVLTVGEFTVWDESVREDAFTADWQGRRYVCPRHPRLRMLEGLLAFRNAYPGATAAMLVPESIAARAMAELESYRDAVPEARSHILTSAWHVPVRWFAAFDPSEKEVYEGPDGPRLRFRADITRARERIDSRSQAL